MEDFDENYENPMEHSSPLTGALTAISAGALIALIIVSLIVLIV